MRSTFAALVLLSSVLALNAPNAFADDNLFPDNLFPDDKSKPLFSDFTMDKAKSSSSSSKNPDAQKKELKAMVSRADNAMRREMQNVASWLQEFSMRNQNRFPGQYIGSGDLGRAAEVQLTELVGPNPYASASGYVQAQGLNGLSPGLAAYYNSDGTPVSNSPLANDEWTSEIDANNAHRIQLLLDSGASDGEIASDRSDPPLSWQAAPGTITACGNGQGFIYVWGAGIDGKPLKDFDGKTTLILTALTGNTTGDQGQEAGF